VGRGFIFGGPVLEPGDYAANALQVMQAKHFLELLGNYSRWHFHHPGPIFFYVYAFSEYVLYDWLGIVASPHQAHVLGGIALQSTFIGLACLIAARHAERSATAFIMLASIMTITGAVNAGGPSSIWPPHVLFGPFLLMCVSAASAFMGRNTSLYIMVVAGCFCVHGHVAQPVFVAPIGAFAAAGWWLEKRRGGAAFPQNVRAFWFCLVIVLLFLVPIAIDAIKNSPSNIQNIISYMGADNGETPSLKTAVRYVMGYWLFIPKPEDGIDHAVKVALVYVAILVVITLFANISVWLGLGVGSDRSSESINRFLGLLSVVVMGAILLSILWGGRITGPLYEFNSFYIYALVALTAFLAVERISRSEIFNSIGFIKIAGCVLVFTLGAFAFFKQNMPFSEQQAFSSSGPLVDGDLANRTVAVEFVNASQWLMGTAIVLDVARSKGIPRISRDWAFMMGEQKIFLPGEERFPADGVVVNVKPNVLWVKGSPILPSDICAPVAQKKSLALGSHGAEVGKLLRECDVSSFGVSSPEGDYVYTLEAGAVIQYHMANREQGVAIFVDPFVAPGKPGQRLVVALNGKEFFNSEVRSGQLIDVPSGCADCTLEFMTPDSFSPASVAAGPDQRKLGFKLSRMLYTDEAVSVRQRP